MENAKKEMAGKARKPVAVQRRQFLGLAAGAGAGLLVARSGLLGAEAPSKKLNVAMIATAGQAGAHFGVASSENIVALCDVNEKHLESAAKRFPNAKTYVDWRKCLDQKDIDTVICSTTDFTHAFVANWALNRDMHVYCEKPLGNSVEEARVVRANYLKRKDKVATQCGTQRHEFDNFNRVAELIRDGAIGELSQAHAWGDRQIRSKGYLPAQGEPPKHLNYDLWLGPSPFHPYNPGYFGGCLAWNMYWDFGSGQIGDMGSHTMDLVWNAIDPVLPTSAQAEAYPAGSAEAGGGRAGEKGKPAPAQPIPPHPEVTPVELHSTFDMPANGWRPAIKVNWWQGGMLPRSPRGYVDLRRIDHGAMFKGKNGFLVCDFGSRILIPSGDADNMTYYKPRTKEQLQPPVAGFEREWIAACKDPSKKTHCDFDYSGTMIETMLLGLVAYRAGKKIAYDGAKGAVTDNDEANALLSRKYREGWTLNG